MYKRVLVPVDGSPLAAAILPFIAQIAGPLDAEVMLARVVPSIPPQVVEGSRHIVIDDMVDQLAEAKGYLEDLAAVCAAQGVRVHVQVRSGDPVLEILAAAREAGADLIAMTTHGRTGLGRLLFGSVAGAVLRRAGVPVFLMRLTKEPAPDLLPFPGQGGPYACR